MIEIIYKDESRESKDNSGRFYIPRNVRQIGFCGGKNRIYVEDYVYTFVNRMTEKNNGENGGLAILFGKTEWEEGISYIFIKGAVYLNEAVNAEHILLENDAWKKIQETGEKYFSDLDVVGWFLTLPQMTMEITELIGKTHLKYFGGGEKIMMLMEPQEKDEAFFYYENGKFVKVPGYYLYYEKNLKMQEYMMEHKWWETSENEKIIPDEAVKNFRKKFMKKEKESEEKIEKSSVFSYVATASLVIAIMVTGASFIRNYQKIQTVEKDMEASAVLTVNDQVQISPTPFAERKEDNDREKVEVSKINDVDEEKVADKIKTDEKTDEKAEESGTQNEHSKNANKNTIKEAAGIEEVSGKSKENDESNEQETSGKNVLNTYMVRPGDTLYQISILNYGDMNAITEICRMNNISEEEMIYPGQIIVLP